MNVKKFLKRFRQDTKALAAIWAIAACTLAFFPLIYWVMSVLLDGVATTVFGMITFVGVTASAWLLVKAVIAALPVFVILTVVLWSAVNAKAQSYE